MVERNPLHTFSVIKMPYFGNHFAVRMLQIDTLRVSCKVFLSNGLWFFMLFILERHTL